MMKATKMRMLLIVLSANLLIIYSYGQAIQSGKHKSAVDSASKFIKHLQSRLGIPGISVCVGNSKEVLWADAFGMADLKNNTPVTRLQNSGLVLSPNALLLLPWANSMAKAN